MVLPPSGTPLAIAGTDPRALRAMGQGSLRALRAPASDIHVEEAVEQIHTAAALGFEAQRPTTMHGGGVSIAKFCRAEAARLSQQG